MKTCKQHIVVRVPRTREDVVDLKCQVCKTIIEVNVR